MSLPPLIALLRPRQWVKNAFVAAPLFFTPEVLSWAAVAAVLAAIVCFSAVSSGVYILNDLADREADRLHPVKRLRPLAAGSVQASTALALAGPLLLGGLVGAFVLAADFAWVLLAYLVMQAAYNIGLKRLSVIDVTVIALGFVLRVVAGGAVIAVAPSAWILIATGLLALFLALAKRRDDLVRNLGSEHRDSLRGYNKPFLDTALAVVLGALLVAYLIYTTDAAVMARLGTDKIFYTGPFVVVGVLRYLQITFVEERSGSPTDIVLSDPMLISVILGWVLTFAMLIYL
jgi:4-hydroxybenzoate polyprenyltransferase